MTLLIMGLLLFIGIHSISIVALPLRDRLLAGSEAAYKITYSLLSLAGLILISKGYAAARMAPVVLYDSPLWLKHVAALLLLPVFVLFLSSVLPGRIKRTVKNPLLIATKTWAIAHLLVNGTLADVLLFGSFLAWAVLVRISYKRRPVRDVPGLPESNMNDVLAIVLGLGLYVATVFWLHESLFGIAPFVR